MYIRCILYCLLFIPENAQTYMLKYFVSISTCFKCFCTSSGCLNFALASYMQNTPTQDFHILYAATKQIPRFINIYAFYHTTIHCLY
jgi:hypothetical protein